MDAQDQLSQLIASIYDAAIDGSLWTKTLETFGDALGGAALVLSVIHEAEGIRFSATCRLDSHYDRLLREQFSSAQTNPLVAAMSRLPVNRTVPRLSIYPDKNYLNCDLYQDIFRPQQLIHRSVACVSRIDHQIMPFGLLRSTTKGEFDAQQLALIDRVLPHLRRAVGMYLRLGKSETSTHWQADVLDRLPFGVAMISAHGRVLLLNAHAQTAIAQNDGLGCDAEGLCTARPSDTARLRLLIKDAVAVRLGEATHAGSAMLIRRPSGRRSFQLLINPYRPRDTWPGLEQPAATLFITDPESQPEHSTATLRRLYSLTPAEAKLTVMLMHGLSIAEAAGQLRITRNTARTHLKMIFLKTGTRRQADLVHQLLIGPALLL